MHFDPTFRIWILAAEHPTSLPNLIRRERTFDPATWFASGRSARFLWRRVRRSEGNLMAGAGLLL